MSNPRSTPRSNRLILKLLLSATKHVSLAGYYWLRDLIHGRKSPTRPGQAEHGHSAHYPYEPPPDSHICRVSVPDLPTIDYGGCRAWHRLELERLNRQNNPVKPDYCTVPGGTHHQFN